MEDRTSAKPKLTILGITQELLEASILPLASSIISDDEMMA